jgi:hypothetical protein
MRLPARPNYSTFNPLVLQTEARWVYELCVGKQPTVGPDLSRPPPIYRPVAPLLHVADKSGPTGVPRPFTRPLLFRSSS